MDALSEALKTVRMTGAIFFNAEFSAPWGFAAPPASTEPFLPALPPGTEHIVVFHLVIEGGALARVAGAADMYLVPGDIVIFPHGDAHAVSNGSPSTLIDTGVLVGKFLAGDLSVARRGGRGATTRFICGFLGCDRYACRMFLAGLPAMIKINIRSDPAGEWLERSIGYLVAETSSERAGRMVLISKMAEALFIEALRRYMAQLPPEQAGWLAGARDPIVGSTLALLHRRPCHSWTVAELAAEVGASRSVLAERFGRFLGEPPLGYLTRWRLQLATGLLETRKTIVQVASEVGYESEAAFNRAFKREFGLPPAQYRRKRAANGAGSEAATRGLPTTAPPMASKARR